MKAIFADTGFWIALLNTRDFLAPRAEELAASYAGRRIVTSDLVLVETLNSFSGAHRQMRSKAANYVEDILANPEVTVESLSSDSFVAALKFYAARPDKSWSMTDCASFLIMERYGMDSALTCDRHFEQAGFKALLR